MTKGQVCVGAHTVRPLGHCRQGLQGAAARRGRAVSALRAAVAPGAAAWRHGGPVQRSGQQPGQRQVPGAAGVPGAHCSRAAAGQLGNGLRSILLQDCKRLWFCSALSAPQGQECQGTAGLLLHFCPCVSQSSVSTSCQCSPATACTGDLQACKERCSRALQGIRGCCCSGLRALILTQRASCQLQQGSLQKALEDCCAALAAEPGSPDALHLKYQVASLNRFPHQPAWSDLCIRLPFVFCV